MGQAGERRDRLGQRLAVGGDQLAGEAGCGDDGDLLAKDGAHAELEAVPGAGHAQARPGGDQRRQMRIPRSGARRSPPGRPRGRTRRRTRAMIAGRALSFGKRTVTASRSRSAPA